MGRDRGRLAGFCPPTSWDLGKGMMMGYELPLPSHMPGLFRAYEWDKLHAAFGWPADRCDTGFAWMVSLWDRFAQTIALGEPPGLSLIVEMVLWGGNQNNILTRFSEGLRLCGECEGLLSDVIACLDRPGDALGAAMRLPGFGLTYGSKTLLFCCPARYGALDSRLRRALVGQLPRIHDGNVRSMRRGYEHFLGLLYDYQETLATQKIERPSYGDSPATTTWTAAEVETALFSWATRILA